MCVLVIVLLTICPAYAQDDPVSESPNARAEETMDMRLDDGSFHKYAGVMVNGAYRGISARIVMPSSYPNVQDSGESAWVSTHSMMSSAVGGEVWIQSGAAYYAVDQASGFLKYIEEFSRGYYYRNEYDTHDLGEEVVYKVEYSSSDGKWYAYIDGVQMVGFRFPVADCGVQAHAEVHKDNIQMGPFIFYDIRVRNDLLQWSNNTVLPTAQSPYTVTGSATTFVASGP